MLRSGLVTAVLIAVLASAGLLLGAPLPASVVVAALAGGALWLQRRALGLEPIDRSPASAERHQRGSVLKAVGDNAPMAIVVFNDTGKITYANGEARTLFADGQELKDQNFLRLVQGAPESLQQALVRDGDALFTVEQAG